MSSIPYSRYLIYPIPWYSFLIVLGASLAILLACREERRAGLPKDTVVDLALRILPSGIIGARLYYVVFSWSQFRGDLLSVFRIWEGGLAIYGGILSGLFVLVIFSRRRDLSPLQLCDLIVPGLALAQSIGRWGNWFNIEAYGITVSQESLCFFPFAVQVPTDGYAWHLATFFYESVWDFMIFLFLVCSRHRLFRKQGDILSFYLFLYAAGRLVIEELRTDSLFATSTVRVSQLLSILICVFVLCRYVFLSWKNTAYSFMIKAILFPIAMAASSFALLYALSGSFLSSWPKAHIVLFLSAYSLLMILFLFIIYFLLSSREVSNADNRT